VSEYAGRQFVGIDVHRKRSVLVRTGEDGQRLETTRISNDPEYLRAVMARAGESPEVVLEACYGWYWAADTLAELGANVHLAHPLGVKGFAYRRVKNDVVDAGDLADLLRMGRLPEAWIAPPAVRELRELVRHRAKLVGLRTSLKCQVHAVLASAGIAVAMSDLFGVAGTDLLEQVVLPAAMRAKVESCRRVIDLLDFEIAHVAKLVAGRLHQDPGYAAAQTIPGVGPVLGAVFCAEIGDVRRFGGPTQLASWAGLTPRHRESDTKVHRGRITKQGPKLVRWAAIEAVQRGGSDNPIGAYRQRIAERRPNARNQAKVAAARLLVECVFYALRDHHVRRLEVPVTTGTDRAAVA
jgi:transposase